MQTAAYYTLGCKLNFAETSTIARQLEEAGIQRVDFEQGADVYVINTCSVTDHADRKCKKVVAEAKRMNPEAKIVVVGCYAQLKPEEIAEIPGVNLVLGAREKFNALSFLNDLPDRQEKASIARVHIKETRQFHHGFSYGDRTRTFLKVQDGCDYFCSFCTIPLARGRSRNPSIAEVLEQAKAAKEKGAAELVLTGVNIGDFGKSNGETFSELVKALDREPGMPRIRISSIEPNLLSTEIIERVAASKVFQPHFHIPLQSGSDSLLKAMRRRYRTELYANRVAKIKALMPHASIGVDVIVGFPGETEALFEETYAFLQSLEISYLHVFTYSERPNTTALRLSGSVPFKVRKERNKRLRILSDKMQEAHYQKHLGSQREVLWEHQGQDQHMLGYTDNYIRVVKAYDPEFANETETVKLDKIDPEQGWVLTKPIITADNIPAGLKHRLVQP